MADFDVGTVNARDIQMADTIINEVGPPRDHFKDAVGQLRAERYRAAARAYSAVLDENPDDLSARYGLALSLLAGKRPHDLNRATMTAIVDNLRSARALPEARALYRLVLEDDSLAWRRWSELPDEVLVDLDLIAPRCAEEITHHVPAPEARVWQALKCRAEAPGEMP